MPFRIPFLPTPGKLDRWQPGALAIAVMMAMIPLAGLAQSTSEARSVRFAVAGANDSGLEARVKLIDLGEQTRIVISIRGAAEGEYLPHLHSGNCDTYDGTPTFPLTWFAAGERSRTTVDISYDELIGGGFLIDIHPWMTAVDTLFDPATAVVCGEIGELDSLPNEPTPLPPEDDLVVTRGPDTGVGPLPDQYGSTMLIALSALLAVILATFGYLLRRRAMLSLAQRRLERLTGREL